MPQENSKKHQLPQRSLAYLFYLSFGIFGTQMAFGLESSQLGRLFQTIGASPELLGIIFIIPPLTGLFVQPIIGKYSDQTWLPKLGGRRVPYLIIGSILTALTLILLPNSGSFGWPTTIAVWVATAILGIFMIASNIAVQPYKMMVGDLVNQEQRGQAYSIQSQLLNAGATIASITPFVMTTFGMANTAEAGVVPATVKYAFYLAAFALLVSATITVVKIKENNPIEFAAVHGGDVDQPRKSMWQLTKEAPRIFWLVGLVQFFGFFAVSYLWVYGAGFLADNIYNTTDTNSIGYQMGGNLIGIYSGLYCLVAVIVTIFLARLKKENFRIALSIAMFLSAFSFGMMYFAHDLIWMTIAFVIFGAGWAGLNIYPVTFITDAVSREYMGSYIGLMNVQICIPQIAASLLSVVVLPLFKGSMPAMILFSAFFFLAAAFSSLLIKNKDI